MKLLFQLTAVLIVLTSCGALAPMSGKMRLVKTGNDEEITVMVREERPEERIGQVDHSLSSVPVEEIVLNESRSAEISQASADELKES